MKTGRYIRIGIPLMILLVFGQNTNAAISDDPDAMDGWSHSVDFNTGGALKGHIDYAVYEPKKYDSFIDLYIYAYQVFNDNLTVGIDYFSVGLSPDVQVPQALYDLSRDTAEAGGSIPDTLLVLPQSVIYIFQRDNIIAGEHSRTLLFTSNCGPQMAWGVVSGGLAGGAIMGLPTPIPEPATMGLLIGGALFAFRRRRNAANVQREYGENRVYQQAKNF